MKIYLVGGAVRDQALGLDVYDKDWVVVGATPEVLIQQGYHQVGKDFPVFLHPKTKEEYALARQERKSGTGYTGFICDFSPTVTLEDDLIRRDLTINAMAEDEQGHIIDPYGGMQDLQNKVLRHVSPAFAEDPLRVLRVCRFAAKLHHVGFSVAPDTLELMRQISKSSELKTISAERVWRETEKALTSDSPSIYFELLKKSGALEVLFPELYALVGVPQTEKWHPEIDTFVHTMMSLKIATKLTDSIPVRLATLLHDLGKGITDQALLPKHHAHEIKGKPLVTALCKRLTIPKEMMALAEQVCEFHLHSHKAFELKPKTLLKVLNKLNAFKRPERLDQFLLACEADARGRLGFENKAYPQTAYVKAVLHAASQVGYHSIDQAKFQGKAISDEIHRLRVEAIKTVQKPTLTD